MSINFNELRELLGAIAQTDITELSLKTDAFELSVRKNAGQIPVIVPATPYSRGDRRSSWGSRIR